MAVTPVSEPPAPNTNPAAAEPKTLDFAPTPLGCSTLGQTWRRIDLLCCRGR